MVNPTAVKVTVIKYEYMSAFVTMELSNILITYTTIYYVYLQKQGSTLVTAVPSNSTTLVTAAVKSSEVVSTVLDCEFICSFQSS